VVGIARFEIADPSPTQPVTFTTRYEEALDWLALGALRGVQTARGIAAEVAGDESRFLVTRRAPVD
jgi:hypothetical protein